MGCSLVQRSLPSVLIRLRNLRCEAAKVLTSTVEPHDDDDDDDMKGVFPCS
jgi:hypothetical protein